MRSVLFVCTANICRSPTAEGVFRKLIAAKAPNAKIEIDSVGTHDYHVGNPPFPLAVDAARKRGYEIEHLVARRVSQADLDHFDMILGMDRANISHLRTIAPTRCKQKIELLLEYGDKYHGKEVPDPYGGDPKAFEHALDMIEDGCQGVAELVTRLAR
ncbi:MAG TPA: low molecular weight protein-tyrosine-phosphatase [Usitatibacter sp.]